MAKIHNKEWSGVTFFRVNKGSLDKPEELEIEMIDFLLMDLGSTGFTSFKWTSDISDYQMAAPELMEDGVRTGCLHSHHTMPTFFSGEDIDDLVINTRDENVDFYLSTIVNVDGKWIARVAFRMDSIIETKSKATFASKLLKGLGVMEHKEKVSMKSLYMIPLKVVQEEYMNTEGRIAELEAADRSVHSWTIGNMDTKPANQVELFGMGMGQEEDSLLEAEDKLLGSLMVGSILFKDGLDKAVTLFRRQCTDMIGNPLNTMLHQWAVNIIERAQPIITAFEGKPSESDYVEGWLGELTDILSDEYSDGPFSAESMLVKTIESLIAQGALTEISNGTTAE